MTPHIVTLRSHDCCSGELYNKLLKFSNLVLHIVLMPLCIGMSAIVKEIHNQLVKGWIPDRVRKIVIGNDIGPFSFQII